MSDTHDTDLSAHGRTIFGLEARNRAAEELIGRYARKHQWIDVGMGAAGAATMLPGAGVATLMASIVAQGPMFYKPMAKKLAEIYMGNYDAHTKRIVNEAWLAGMGWDVANEFNAGFFKEIAGEVIQELGWGGAAAALPIIGGVVGAALDALVAATMTWRVGTMVSVYFQNGGKWLEGRRHTFEIAKDFVGPISIKAKNRVDLTKLSEKHNEILASQLVTLKSVLLDPLIDISDDEDQILKVLRKRDISEELVAQSVPYIKEELLRKTLKRVAG